MKIKQVTFYALWALRIIYLEDESIVTSNVISEKANLSQGVLLRILRQLCEGGILESHQGRGKICGGFSLKKNIRDITLLEVVEVIEGETDMCQKAKNSFQESDTPMYEVFNTVNQNLRKDLAEYSIHDVFNLN